MARSDLVAIRASDRFVPKLGFRHLDRYGVCTAAAAGR
jgi:hypothetical protein